MPRIIAIPIFIAQRERGWVAQTKSTLKNASTAIESYGAGNGGKFSSLDGADSVADNAAYRRIVRQGFKGSNVVDITVAVPAGGDEFCITATHVNLDAGHEWKVGTYNSSGGSPIPADADAC